MIPNKIPMEEWLSRCGNLLQSITGGIITSYQTVELFNLHNDKMLPRETGRSCSGCRARVYKKVTDYYNEHRTQ